MDPTIVLVLGAFSVACVALGCVLMVLASLRQRRSKATSRPRRTTPAAGVPPKQQPQEPVSNPAPTTGQGHKCKATYYGPDNNQTTVDNIFIHIPAGQYTPDQLRKIASHHCAMTEAWMRKGYMGKIIRIKGSKASMDFAVVDLLPDRMDGKGVEIDIHGMADWLALGGDAGVGIQEVTFSLVGPASIPVPGNSPWDPKKFGF